MKFKEILSLDKKLAKQDKVTLYRAYVMKDGEEMQLPTDGELFFLTKEKAFENLINREDILTPLDQFITGNGGIGPMITFLNIIFDVKTNKDKELMPGFDGGYNEESGSIQIALNNLAYDLDVEDMRVVDLTTVTKPETEIIRVKKLTLEDFWADSGEKKKKKK